MKRRERRRGGGRRKGERAFYVDEQRHNVDLHRFSVAQVANGRGARGGLRVAVDFLSHESMTECR